MFNLKGKDKVHTLQGGLMTCAILIVISIYASIKLIQLFDKHNPNVSQIHEKDVHDMNDRISLNDINFRFAFSFEGYHSREMKNDPRYVKYLVRIFGIHEG